MVRQSWVAHITGGGNDSLIIFSEKLKCLNRVLIEWNIKEFNNVFKQVVEAENALKEVEVKMETNSYGQCVAKYNAATNKLNQCLEVGEMFWRQRAKAKWLKECHKNTNFFYVSYFKEKQR